MAFDAPAPGVLRRRRAEHREEIPLRIADERRIARRLRRGGTLRRLERAQHRFQVHDRFRGEIAALAEAGLDQLVRERPLRLAHLLDREPLARERLGRDEMPVEALVRREIERRLLALLRRQAVEKLRRRRRHRRRRPVGTSERGQGKQPDDGSGDVQAGRNPFGHNAAPVRTSNHNAHEDGKGKPGSRRPPRQHRDLPPADRCAAIPGGRYSGFYLTRVRDGSTINGDSAEYHPPARSGWPMTL